MDKVTFEQPPEHIRRRALGVVVAALVFQGLAVFILPWWRGDGEWVRLVSRQTNDGYRIVPSDIPHMLVQAALLLGWIAYVYRFLYVGVTVYRGQPAVRRGLFRSKLLYAWGSATVAHVHTAIISALAIITATDHPNLEIGGRVIPGEFPYRFGGIVLVVGLVLAHVALVLVARDRRLAAMQLWRAPGVPSDEPAQPARASRPMIKPPLSAPPTGVTGDPFRDAPKGPSLEDKLVRPALPTSAPKVVASDNADEPSLLR